MKYYKVVTNQLQSVMVPKRSELCITYIIGEFVKSHIKGSKLFVFKSRHDAESFQYGVGGSIYECEVINPNNNISVFQTIRWDKKIWDVLSKIWKLKRSKKKFTHLLFINEYCNIPPGSVFVDEVKLVKQIR